MDQTVFACLVPHGWLTVPLVSGRDGERATATHTALAELGRRLALARPQTSVVADPHGQHRARTFRVSVPPAPSRSLSSLRPAASLRLCGDPRHS